MNLQSVFIGVFTEVFTEDFKRAIPEDSWTSKCPKVDTAGEMLRNIAKLPVHPP
jgi:hypothetical protein